MIRNSASEVLIRAPVIRLCSRLPKRTFSTTHSRNASWGFIGLGAMGYPMVQNLRRNISKEDRLYIYDTNLSATTKFKHEATAENGEGETVVVADRPHTVAENSETIFTVLPEPKHVKTVFEDIVASQLPPLQLANRGAKSPVAQERLFIDCSTIDPVSSKEIAAEVSWSKSGEFVDAPMSGGVVGARAGTLTFMVGASRTLFPRVEAILQLMGKRIWHLGDQGAGLSGKLANNYALAINNIAAAEAMNLGLKWGLNPKVLADLINSSTGRSWPSEVNNPVPGVIEASPSSRDYEGGFGISLMRKDLKLAMTAALEADARLELAEKARDVYEAAEKEHGGKDFSVVYRYLGGKE